MKLCFASNNQYKLAEIQKALPDFNIVGLKDIGFHGEIEESGVTLEENSIIKAKYIFEKYHISCFADDTGLEIDALNGEPGVYSARYAGEECSFDDNVDLVLKKLKNVNQRAARFRTVITYIDNSGQQVQFEGIVDGQILQYRKGEGGFGYDPIFQPIGQDRSFAEMQMDEKNKISHRGRAISKLVSYFQAS